MSDKFAKRQKESRESGCCSAGTVVQLLALVFFGAWIFVVAYHLSPVEPSASVNTNEGGPSSGVNLRASVPVAQLAPAVLFEDTDESYHLVFSTGCSEFQDWQSIGVYSSADAVGQRGIITRIASGCTEQQKVSLRHAMAHLPKRCRIHFAPDTDVKDHAGRFYKYANKPLGMMHWLMHADPKVTIVIAEGVLCPQQPSCCQIPAAATVVLIDPDFYFLKPLWHDSFDAPDKYIATGGAKKTPMPRDDTGRVRLTKGSMIAQRYGIGGKPWTLQPGRNKQKAWALDQYFSSIGRPNSPALAPDLLGHENRAGDFYSIGAPYFALASDWLPIATNWTALMYMSVERNFGNLAEMYAMVIAVADCGIRPAMIDSLMVSNVDAGDEGWPWIDKLPMDRGCDPEILNEDYPLPTFLHYCQTYIHPSIGPGPGSLFSKYQVPDAILDCPAGSKAADGGGNKKKRKGGGMVLDSDGFLPEPDVHSVANTKKELRHIFSHCFATRGTNQAARDYRSWFCSDHAQ